MTRKIECFTWFLFFSLIMGCNSKPYLDDAVKAKAESETLRQQVNKIDSEAREAIWNIYSKAETQYNTGTIFIEKDQYKKAVEAYKEASNLYQNILDKQETIEILSQTRKDVIRLRTLAESAWPAEKLSKAKKLAIKADYYFKKGDIDLATKTFNEAREAYAIWEVIVTPAVTASASATESAPAELQKPVDKNIEKKREKAKEAWKLALAKTDIDTLTKYAPDQFQKIQQRVKVAESFTDSDIAIKMYNDAIDMLKKANEDAATNRKTALANSLIEQLKLAIDRKDKWISSDLIEQIESLVPNDPQIVTLHRKIDAIPGPPKNLTINLGKDVKMEFVLIRPGTFNIGTDDFDSGHASNGPVHRVTISKPFYIGKYEVTQEQWRAIMGNNPSVEIGIKKPVHNLSWLDCQSFVRELSNKIPGHTFSLPTEAQWEYACRAGKEGTKFCFGDSIEDLQNYAWCGISGVNPISDVGQKKPNAWGLFDMHGNIWEWCSDWLGVYDTFDQTDPTGPQNGSTHIARGGSAFTNDPRRLYCADRNGDMPPDKRNAYFGFRVVSKVGKSR